MDSEKFQELVLQQFDKVFKRFETMQGDMKTMQGDIDKVRQSQTCMEHDHGEKLGALFEGHKMLMETLTDHTVRLERIEEKVTGHDIKIEILDKTKANKRKAR